MVRKDVRVACCVSIPAYVLTTCLMLVVPSHSKVPRYIQLQNMLLLFFYNFSGIMAGILIARANVENVAGPSVVDGADNV